jgi:hypothetical protein
MTHLADLSHLENLKLTDRVLDQIQKDIASQNLTAIAELLTFVPVENLRGYLPEAENMITSWESAKVSYDMMLDEEREVMVAGLQFWPSEILRRLDPIAYRTGLNDYLDALGVDSDEFDSVEDLIGGPRVPYGGNE